MDTFTRQYIVTALWSSIDDDGNPLDDAHDINDIHPDTLERMADDCAQFQRDNTNDIIDNIEQAGHDFWLTRNHHGAGFWDGDWSEPAATRLTDAAHAYGECDLYIGDDGLIYAM